ncbi:MAG TPA: NAD(P)/FAD-dependent oxidoreductase [Kofleriaceae bacterium]|nr:NAD(P)/FAD-dependent oxidoreductase [Kofleriaceae bacterium]
MRIGTSYKQNPITRARAGSYDAIVIGSGLGGLTFAALAAKHAGKKVLVLERHYTAGGFTHVFHRKGYEWDVGVHYIGEVHKEGSLMRRLFDDITEAELEWADMGEVYDTIIIGDDRYELVAGRENFRRKLHGYFPARTAEIDEYIDRVRKTVGKGKNFFLEKALPNPLSRVIGPAMRWPLLREARKTTMEVMREITDDERLIAVLTGQYGDYGLPPSQSSWFVHCMIVQHYFGGGAYPVGGSARIAETILPVIEAAGGAVYTNAEVAEIVIEGGRAVGVKLLDGTLLRAPMIVSDAGLAVTYGRLLPRAVAAKHGLSAAVPGAPPSVAHVSLYLGLDATAAELGLSKSNLWIYPDQDHDGNVARFIADPEAPLPVAYVSFPSAKDPDFERRHPGKGTIEVITLAPYEWFQRYEGTKWGKRGAEYDALKQRLTDRLLAALLAQVPQLEGHIDHAELSTPLSTQNFAAHPHGEIYGLAHTPERFDTRWLRPQTPIRGLYLTGADICSCGIGGALFGGVLTASSAFRRNLLGAIMKAPPVRRKPAASPACDAA